jgi:hypothetical protein
VRTIPLLLALAASLVLTACGSSDRDGGETPLACTTDPQVYLDALDTAPDSVLIDGETPISACVVPDQSAADLSDLGTALVKAASQLNSEAREDPDGEAAVQLGYLVGSVEEGASETQGLHADLVLRLNSAARYAGEKDGALPASFERAFGAGYAAAREAG